MARALGRHLQEVYDTFRFRSSLKREAAEKADEISKKLDARIQKIQQQIDMTMQDARIAKQDRDTERMMHLNETKRELRAALKKAKDEQKKVVGLEETIVYGEDVRRLERLGRLLHTDADRAEEMRLRTEDVKQRVGNMRLEAAARNVEQMAEEMMRENNGDREAVAEAQRMASTLLEAQRHDKTLSFSSIVQAVADVMGGDTDRALSVVEMVQKDEMRLRETMLKNSARLEKKEWEIRRRSEKGYESEPEESDRQITERSMRHVQRLLDGNSDSEDELERALEELEQL